MKLTLKKKLVIQTIFTESSHYLLVEETNVREKISQMFFLTTVSDTAVKKAFSEFGEVHDVFDSKFKKPYNDISNGKHHIRITPYKTKHDFPMKYYSMTLSFFRSCGLRRNYNAKSVCVHVL